MNGTKALTRRPLHLPSGEEVAVEMGDSFAALGAVVDDGAETIFHEGKVCAVGSGGGTQERGGDLLGAISRHLGETTE